MTRRTTSNHPTKVDADTKAYLLRDVPTDVWSRAKAQAALEGKTIKAAIVELLTNYGDGMKHVKKGDAK